MTLAMKGQVQRKKRALLSELTEGAVLLRFTPSSPRTTFDLLFLHPCQVTTEISPLHLIPAES